MINEGAGLVQVFRWDGVNEDWQQVGGDIVGEQIQEQIGTSLSLSEDGNTLALGATLSDVDEYDPQGLGLSLPGPGYAKIMDYDAAAQEWMMRGNRIDGIDQEMFGRSISLSWDGSTVAVGAYNPFTRNDTSLDLHGRTVVYVWNDTEASWTQLGQDIPGSSGKVKCLSLSADGRSFAVVARATLNEEALSYLENGKSRVFTFNDDDGVWALKGDELFDGTNQLFNAAPSLSGNGQRLAVAGSFEFGNPGDLDGTVVIVHEWNEGDNKWDVIGQEIFGEEPVIIESISLTFDGSFLAAGEPFYTPNAESNTTDPGRVNVYEFKPGM